MERQAVQLPVRMQALGEPAGSGAEHELGHQECFLSVDAGEALRASRVVGNFFVKVLGCQLQDAHLLLLLFVSSC